MNKKNNKHLISVILLLLLIAVDANGQIFRVSSGATFSLGSAILHLPVNWDNSGTFNAQNGTIEFNGASGNQTYTDITGAELTNLSINKTSGEVLLDNDITVNSTLSCVSGDLNLNGKIISLGPTANLSESADATVKGTSGYITATRDLNAPAAVDVAGLGVVITSAVNMGSTEIKRGHEEQSCGSILRYYDITPTTNAGLNATLTLNYDESELNGITEADLQIFRSDDDGTSWLTKGGTLNAANNNVTLTGIEAFSRWTTAVNTPTVLAAIEGTPLVYSEDDPATVITSSITVTDVDDTNIESGLIEITGNYQNGEDVLEFANTANITGTWDAATGRMILTGNDTKANYQTALRNVKYINTNTSDPVTSIQNGATIKKSRSITATPRTVSFTVNDGDNDSNTLTRIINLTAVNDIPILTTNTGAVVDEAGRVVITNSMLNCSDPDGTTYFAYTVVDLPSNGTLQNNGTRLKSLDKFTQEDIKDGKIVYIHDGSETTGDSFSFEVADNSNATSPMEIFEIRVTPVNDPPQLNGLPESLIFTCGDCAVVDICSCAADAETPVANLLFEFSANNNSLITEYDNATGMLTITATDGFDGNVELTIKVTDPVGAFCEEVITITVESSITGIDEIISGTPTEFTLHQNYPNPFNPSTTIRYGIPAVGTHHDVSVRLVVYNMLGQEVAVLIDKHQSAGYHEVIFNANRLNSGIYIYKIEAGSFTEIKKCIFLK